MKNWASSSDDQSPLEVDFRQRLLKSFLSKGPAQAILKYSITFSLVAASLYYVAQKLMDGATEIWASKLHVDYPLLLSSIGLAFVCAVLGGLAWSILVRGLGAPMSIRMALRIHWLSTLPKYAPGFAWQVIGKAYLCGEAGVPRVVTGASMVGESVMILLSGLFVSLIFVPVAELPRDNQIVAFALELPLPVLAVPYGLLVPLGLQKGLKFGMSQRMPGVNLGISYMQSLLAFMLLACSWTIMGLAFSVLSSSLYPVPISLFPSLVFANAVSFILSLLAFFAPLGIGVREGVLIFLLSLWLPTPAAAVIAISARLIFVLVEAVAFAVALRL